MIMIKVTANGAAGTLAGFHGPRRPTSYTAKGRLIDERKPAA